MVLQCSTHASSLVLKYFSVVVQYSVLPAQCSVYTVARDYTSGLRSAPALWCPTDALWCLVKCSTFGTVVFLLMELR
jgi:hypothetical protein